MVSRTITLIGYGKSQRLKILRYEDIKFPNISFNPEWIFWTPEWIFWTPRKWKYIHTHRGYVKQLCRDSGPINKSFPV